jgi:tetratricopeptide (TPR) repeat protein
MLSETSQARAVHVFHSYAQEDSEFFKTLTKHLSVWQRQGLIENWDRHSINAGDDWKNAMEEYLQKSDIILLLISPDFIASDDCFNFEMLRAMKQYKAGKASVIPIILRPSPWYDLPCASLQSLPRSNQEDVKPIVLWENQDLAFAEVVNDLLKVVAQYNPSLAATIASARPVDDSSLLHIPYPRNNNFTGRDSLLTSLHDLFTARHSTFPTRQALIGLGGSGKTQIALEYTYRNRNDYQAIFWIKADTREHLVTDFMGIADQLQLPERSGKNQEPVIAAIKRWFQGGGRWLLIFDNVEDATLIDEFAPTAGKGHILITSRNQMIRNVTAKIELDRMEPDEGVLLLLRCAEIIQPDIPLQEVSTTDITEARAIVQLVDGHPLALDQAGAYIKETETSLASYIRLYNERAAFLLNQRGEPTPDHLNSVAATFTLSLQKVKFAKPHALELLRFCAFLHADAIPEDLIIKGTAASDSPLQLLASDPVELNAAIKELRQFSLIQRYRETGELAIHRLVQVVIKDEMTELEQRQWAEYAVRAINHVFPKVEAEAWFLCQQYLPHALTCLELIKHWKIELPEAGRLLHDTGSYLYAQAQYLTAQPLYELALKIREHTLGLEHPDTAQALNSLGEFARKQANYDEAEDYYKRALAIRERALGSEHPQTAQTLNNLGELAQTRGKHALAEIFYRQALTIRQRSLGNEHPDTIRSIGDVAGIRDEQDDTIQAEEGYKKALTLCEQTRGPQHIDTALALSKLARFYRSQKMYTQAEPLFKRALTLTEQKLGTSHPEVATIFNNFAILYRLTGNYTQAELLLKWAINIWEQVFDIEHPNTAASLNNLGLVYSDQGNYAQAEPLYLQALAIREKKLGKDHHSTAQTLANLADLYQAQNRDAQAAALYLRVLDIYMQDPGPEHSDTKALQEKYATLQSRLDKDQ